MNCLLYTSDAADEEDSVDLGGRRIIKKLFCFIPYLKDFVLVNKFFHLTSCGILRYGRVFKHTIFFKTYF